MKHLQRTGCSCGLLPHPLLSLFLTCFHPLLCPWDFTRWAITSMFPNPVVISVFHLLNFQVFSFSPFFSVNPLLWVSLRPHFPSSCPPLIGHPCSGPWSGSCSTSKYQCIPFRRKAWRKYQDFWKITFFLFSQHIFFFAWTARTKKLFKFLSPFHRFLDHWDHLTVYTLEKTISVISPCTNNFLIETENKLL